MNAEFLKDLKVKYIVNTAKGLEIFGPKYLVRTLKYSTDIQNSIFKKCRHTHTHTMYTQTNRFKDTYPCIHRLTHIPCTHRIIDSKTHTHVYTD